MPRPIEGLARAFFSEPVAFVALVSADFLADSTAFEWLAAFFFPGLFFIYLFDAPASLVDKLHQIKRLEKLSA